MTNSSNNDDKRFLALLQKWQSGDFTRADEQEMNALAGADEFRQEALEGLLAHPEFDHALALASLSKKIRKKQPARKIAFPQIMALAAALALLFVAIWFFNIRPIPQNQDLIALEVPVPYDTINEADAPAETTATSSQEPGINDKSQSNAPLPAAPQSSAGGKGQDFAPAKESQELAGSLASEDQEEPAEYGNVAVAEQKSEEPHKRPGAIREQSTNVALPAERAQQAASRSAKKAKAKPSPTYSTDELKKPEPVDEVSSAAQPNGGWDAFRLYLNANARLTPAALANNATGTVRLQFRLDNKNIPIDFKVIKGLGYGCDELAIKLVKDFAWQPGTDQPIVVDVPFVR